MREILFRAKAINREKAWHKTNYKNGEWVYGLLRRLYDEQFENLPAEFRNTTGIDEIEVDYKTIGQYTGLTDKNGTKIFEGDIVRSTWRYDKGKTFIVDFSEDRGGWFPFACGDGCGCCEDKTLSTDYAIVIGNIHDNPELISNAINAD